MKKTGLESTFFQIHKILKQIMCKVGLLKNPVELCKVICNGAKVFLDAHLNKHQQFDNIFLSVGIQTRTI